MEQTLTGTVQGNTIILDKLPTAIEGERVEVTLRTREGNQRADDEKVQPSEADEFKWTPEDDRIFEEIYQSRRISTRRPIDE